MNAITSELGIDWKLFISQGINFLILLIALRFLIYKPLVELMDQRRAKIEKGLNDALEAEKRLDESELLKAQKLSEAEGAAVAIIGKAEKSAKRQSKRILELAGKQGDEILDEAMETAKRKENEQMDEVGERAREIIKEAISKAIELNPKDIDKKLIRDAVKILEAGI